MERENIPNLLGRMLRIENHFQPLLAYEAIKGCFTDDQLLPQSKDVKAKGES